MNTNELKAYAPRARREFIAAVTGRAAAYGLTPKKIEPVVSRGDVALIGERAFPISIAAKRRKLEERIQQQGFNQVMEAMAYTWFNRLMAIRFMELHGYLDHGRRVLSHPEKQGVFEILEDCTEVNLPAVDKSLMIELKLDGSKDEELYRLLLLGQCHALHQAMPFLFEAIDDETELLLPDNLTKTDSLIHDLVKSIPEESWDNIEIIGWLYQFYISEKKDQVIGKVVKSEDIPAATQLFTPNWIVKYMVQNSLGAQWLATYPDSKLKGQMEYYIEPAEQTDEVNEQLKAITPTSLNPEELTLIDPASGSGHILVEAYELFKAIYLERGYRQRDVPQLILEKNLFGLDIDERAAQLTGFALMMKGRADDRRLFERGVKLNVMALVDSAALDAEGLANGVKLSDYGLKPGDLTELKRPFEHATTFGSLIQVSEGLASSLPALKQLSEATGQDLFVAAALKCLGPLVKQAETLAGLYDAVVANPPYMGGKYYCTALKQFVNSSYREGKADLYGAFTMRNILLAKDGGHVGMITIPNWMFLSSFEELRRNITNEAPISVLVHNGRGVWGSDFGSCSYILQRCSPRQRRGRFLRLFDKQGSVSSNTELERRFHANPRFSISNEKFERIPGNPVAYWVSEAAVDVFENPSYGESASVRQGMATTDNERFLRQWHEISNSSIGFDFVSPADGSEAGYEWFPYNKGGEYRKWYGNFCYVINYEDNGTVLIDLVKRKYPKISDPEFVIKNRSYYCREAITWSDVTSGKASFRYVPRGFLFDGRGSCIFPLDNAIPKHIAYLNTPIVMLFAELLNPTAVLNPGEIKKLPFSPGVALTTDDEAGKLLVRLGKTDWDEYETSWDFKFLPLLTASSDPTSTLESSYTSSITQNKDTIAEMKRLEEENNRLFIDAYGLADELSPDVPIEQITLTVNPAYRYGGKLSEDELWTRFRQDTMEELVSYAIGCMMGRYSLDAPGLIYAHSGNEGFDPSRYSKFPADDDGIIPLTDAEWFDDDAAHRVIEFMSVAWDRSHLEENLSFLAENLGPKKDESSRETIRRYLCDSFFKNHLKTYKNRPIYWLFSSGKEKAFQCLVYLHRYNEGTLSRMRTEYVIPLQGLLASRIEQRDADILAATASSHRKKLEKERDKLVKQRAEIRKFDEKLRHYADQRIQLDLDDGVKVNYGKFSDLLASVKAVTGSNPED